MNECEKFRKYVDKTHSCFDCIFKQVDEYDGTIFCAENGLRVISDVQGYGNDEPCEKLITRGGLVYESR